jgi:[acyl-carrier-protein] S-malonyltransferase
VKAVEKAISESVNYNAKKAIALEVSGPFHCELMNDAVTPLSEALAETTFKDPIKPIISNITAKAETGDFKELLIKQLTGMVRWRESILFAQKNGVSRCIEIGAGKVLTGLVKRIAGDMKTFNVNTLPLDSSFNQ